MNYHEKIERYEPARIDTYSLVERKAGDKIFALKKDKETRSATAIHRNVSSVKINNSLDAIEIGEEGKIKYLPIMQILLTEPGEKEKPVAIWIPDEAGKYYDYVLFDPYNASLLDRNGERIKSDEGIKQFTEITGFDIQDLIIAYEQARPRS